MRRGRLLVGLGVVAIVLAIATAVAAWFVDQRRLDDAVSDLARAAAGCETTIEMRSTGAYAVYLEPQGRAPELPGDCEQAVGSGDGREIEVIAPDGRLVEVDDADGPGYDRAGAVGERIGTIEVTTPGEHRVRVVSPDGGVVAIGRDVDDAGVPWLVVLLAVLGLLSLGVGLLLLGARPPRPEPPAPGAPLPPPFTGLSDFVPVTSPPLVPPPTGPWAPPSVRGGA